MKLNMQWVADDCSERIFTLKENGAPMSLDGCTITLALRDRSKVRGTIATGIRVIDAAAGKIGYTPVPGGLLVSKSPYLARWYIQRAGDPGPRLCPFPDADTWEVIE